MELWEHADWCCTKGCPGEQESLCTSPGTCGEACTCQEVSQPDQAEAFSL